MDSWLSEYPCKHRLLTHSVLANSTSHRLLSGHSRSYSCRQLPRSQAPRVLCELRPLIHLSICLLLGPLVALMAQAIGPPPCRTLLAAGCW